jgi:hypothetical protein
MIAASARIKILNFEFHIFSDFVDTLPFGCPRSDIETLRPVLPGALPSRLPAAAGDVEAEIDGHSARRGLSRALLPWLSKVPSPARSLFVRFFFLLAGPSQKRLLKGQRKDKGLMYVPEPKWL